MAPFSRHAGALVESETLAIAARARRLRAEGREVAPFAAGEPDFETPAHVVEAGVRALQEGRTKYGPAGGLPPLRDVVARHARARGMPDVTPERTVVCAGAKAALYLALQVLLEEGDEVIVPAPAWLSYAKMVQASGARTTFVATRAAGGYVIDPEDVLHAVTPRTRAIVVNSPGNPTGTVQPEAVLREIGRIAADHRIHVLSDEIYEQMVYAPARSASFPSLAPEAADLTLWVSGVSKAYAMTGWRIGYAAGPADLVARMVRLQSHALSAPPEFCQVAALAALEGPTDSVEAMCATFAHRRDVMHRALSAIPDVTCRRPDGAFYVLPDVSAWLPRRFRGEPVGDVTRLGELLIEHAGAAVVPGTPFEAPHAIRLSYACSEPDIRAGVGRIAGFLASLDPA
jgi:aspartate aminotransferase